MRRDRLLLLAAALLPGAAWAQDQALVDALTLPIGEYSAGLGLRTNDGKRANQYLGLRDNLWPDLNFEFSRRDEQTGEWLEIRGRDLAIDTRAFRLENRKQGDWGYYIDYEQTPRLTPYTVNTAVRGIGTNQLTIPYPAATSPKRDTELSTQRDNFIVGVSKLWDTGWDVQVRFRNEEKTGERIFGRGTTGGTGGHEFTPEPIDYTTREVELTLGLVKERLQLSGGYYGSWFENGNSALRINNQPGGPASLGVGASAFTPIALPPDNFAHQFHLAGGYALTPTTRASFKVSHSELSQNDGFIVPALPGVRATSLNGEVETTRLQGGIVSKATRDLTLRADLRHEDRDDKTPLRQYSIPAATSTFNGFNEPRSFRTTVGKAEATYVLPAGFRATGGVDYDYRWRDVSAVRVVSARRDTEETTVRAELRRSLSDTLNGALGLSHSNRTGSPWLRTTLFNGTNGSNLVSPLHLADRDRDKLRALLDWQATDRLSFNLLGEWADDTYSGRTLGPRSGRASTYSTDAAFEVIEGWHLTGFASINDTRAEQVTCENAAAANTGSITACPNTAADPIWQARLRAVTEAFGLGLRGKASERLELGGNLTYARDRNEFVQMPLANPAPIGTPLPDVHTRRMLLTAYAKQTLSRQSGVRYSYTMDVFRSDDPNWNAWRFTDGTTIRQEPTQRVQIFGVSYYHSFR